jgi:hypothetical protein
MINRASLRLSATLLLAGQLLYIVATQFHEGGHANDHPAIFAKYASSGDWKGVHVAQFAAFAIIIAGLIALLIALDVPSGAARLIGRFGAASAVVALALYGALQAVDGVGNKMVDTAWVSATHADKAARFASAESMRWLEWGMRSYTDFALGLALLLAAAVVVQTVGLARPIAYLMGLSGLVYFVQGAVVGSKGFTSTGDTLIVVAWVFNVAWMVWLVVAARRSEDAAVHRPAAPQPA